MRKEKFKKQMDEYFSEKLIDLILDSIKYTYWLDTKVEKTTDTNKYYILCKNKKYNDLQYTQVFSFYGERALSYITDQQSLRKIINDNVKEYLKGDENG